MMHTPEELEAMRKRNLESQTRYQQERQAQADLLAKTDHQTIIELFKHWINQRPGLDPYNYTTRGQLNAEYKRIADQKHDAMAELRKFEQGPWRPDIMHEVLRRRLTVIEYGGKIAFQYCTGQYWPTEYRWAAFDALSSYNLKVFPHYEGEIGHVPNYAQLCEDSPLKSHDFDGEPFPGFEIPKAPAYALGYEHDNWTPMDGQWVVVPAGNLDEAHHIAKYMRQRHEFEDVHVREELAMDTPFLKEFFSKAQSEDLGEKKEQFLRLPSDRVMAWPELLKETRRVMVYPNWRKHALGYNVRIGVA